MFNGHDDVGLVDGGDSMGYKLKVVGVEDRDMVGLKVGEMVGLS